MALVILLAGSQPNVADKAHDDIEDGYLKNVNAKRIWSKHCELRNKRDGPDTKPLCRKNELVMMLAAWLLINGGESLGEERRALWGENKPAPRVDPRGGLF